MSEDRDFAIEFDWMESNSADEISKNFSAAIGLSLNGQYLTRVEDFEAKTNRDCVRASAWQLALWFAANWWRLRWEPETKNSRQNPDWCVSHSIAGAGGGYIWPNAFFISDGNDIGVSITPQNRAPAFETIRYMNAVSGRVSAREFENKAGQFINAVLSRAGSIKTKDSALPDLWNEIQNERRNPALAYQRKMEALAGYDPDNAPESLLRLLLEDVPPFGKTALEEIAADARENTEAAIASMRKITKGGATITMPEADMPIPETGEPWRQGELLAQGLRAKLGRTPGRMDNKTLAGILEARPDFLANGSTSDAWMPFARRDDAPNTYQFFTNKKHSRSKRFALARVMADHLAFKNKEALRPATDTGTHRQKLQRAFAQEFLCPSRELIEMVGANATDDETINDAADYFDVSPQLVTTTLVNKGMLDRERLNTFGN